MKSRTGGRSYVPQVFIGDRHMGSYNEFMILDAMGEVNRLLGIEKKPEPEPDVERVYDLIIIGGGPAGLTAAVYAARKRLDILLIADQIGGQPMITSGVENYMGFDFITGPELMERFQDQAARFTMTREIGHAATGLKLDGLMKKVTIADGRVFTGRTVIVATGTRSRRLGIPGEEEFTACGVSYCATCDGPVFAGKPVMVAGGGNAALEAALEMAMLCPEVHLVSLAELTGDQILRDKVLTEERIVKHILFRPVEIKGGGDGKKEQCVKNVVIEPSGGGDRSKIEVAAIFIEIGVMPNSSLAVDILELNRKGEIVVDGECRTGVNGVFAAGDVTQVRDKQIVVAAGEGAKAALSAQEYLLEQR